MPCVHDGCTRTVTKKITNTMWVCDTHFPEVIYFHQNKPDKAIAAGADLLRRRFERLVSNPDLLDQHMGVCGFAACVRLLLKYRPAKARELFEATFADVLTDPTATKPVFTTASGLKVRIPLASLLGGHSGHGGLWCKPHISADYYLCRAMIFVTEAQNSKLIDKSKTFSDLFEINNWYKAGHFAIDTKCLSSVIRDVLGMEVLSIAQLDPGAHSKAEKQPFGRISGQVTSPAGLAVRMAVLLGDPTVSMVTSVYGTEFQGPWNEASTSVELKGRATPDFASAPTKLRNRYTHWVMVDDKPPDLFTDEISVAIWTWAKKKTVAFNRDELHHYIREVIFVKG